MASGSAEGCTRGDALSARAEDEHAGDRHTRSPECGRELREIARSGFFAGGEGEFERRAKLGGGRCSVANAGSEVVSEFVNVRAKVSDAEPRDRFRFGA